MYLYKYMRYREDFFKEPMLIATQLGVLNDPFEGDIALEQIKKKNNILNKYYGVNEKDSEFEYNSQNDFELIYDEINHEYGIISFSENPLDILMWSHYADEHKGVVIQIKIDDSFLLNDSIKKINVFNGFNHLPQKVNYSTIREAFLFPEEIIPDKKYEFPHKNFYKAVFLNKANNWIYEKEYRSVLELRHADVIQGNFNDYELERLKKLCVNTDIKFDIIDSKTNEVRITYPLNFEFDEDCGDECIRDEIFRIFYIQQDSIYLYKINPQSIKRVIFGTKFEEDINSIIHNSCFEQCEFYKAKVSDTEFKLEIEKIKELIK